MATNSESQRPVGSPRLYFTVPQAFSSGSCEQRRAWVGEVAAQAASRLKPTTTLVEGVRSPTTGETAGPVMNQQRYRVLVDDNFHYMREEERYEAGAFDSYTDALAKCKEIVEECLREQLKPGMTPDEIYHAYVTFGEDPWIAGAPEGVDRFSAWGYARERSREICGPEGEDTGPGVSTRCDQDREGHHVAPGRHHP